MIRFLSIYISLFLLFLSITSCRSFQNIKQINNNITGNGVTDDYDAIQTALDKGGNIYFPSGVYIVSNALHVTKNHTHLKLAKDAVIECNNQTIGNSIYGNAGATLIFNSKSSISNPLEDGERLIDVGIEGGIIRNKVPEIQTRIPVNNENGIGFTHCKNFYCKNVSIEFCNRKGITLQYYNDNGLIENCRLNNCGLHGITIESNSNNIVLKHNSIFMNKASISKGDNTGNGRNYGLHLTDINEIKIIKNEIKSDCGVGIYSNNCNHLIIANNTISSTDERAIVIVGKYNSINFYYIYDNILSGLNYCLYLSGKDSYSNYLVCKNICTSKILVLNCIPTIINNIATICLIDKPLNSCTIQKNNFTKLDFRNKPSDLRLICEGNTIR